jgi:phosphatidylserine/phosphatidylglycerophosphate/cardiolipin synthase-like enzyme
MLIINGEYKDEFIKSVRNSKSAILGFIYHDSLFSSVNGSVIDSYILELRQAQTRGVSIQILCNSDQQVEKLRKHNIQGKRVIGFKTMHSKAFCFDNNYIIVGSHNFTENAVSVNLEMSAILREQSEVQKFVNYFKIIWSS